MNERIITDLNTAADAYNAAPYDDPLKGHLFEAVEQWLAASYEADGATDEEMDQIDLTAKAHEYAARRRDRRS